MELIDENWAAIGPANVDRVVERVWGARYIDDIILTRVDEDASGSFDETWYHLTDHQFSTVALLDNAANLVERVSYDAYGLARHHWTADLTGDGAVTQADRDIIEDLWDENGWTGTAIDETGYRAEADLNRNGIIDEDDFDLSVTLKAALAAGRLSSSDVRNIVGYAGYLFNDEIAAGGQYQVRHRILDAGLGRWMMRDPLGFVDGMNLYEYAMGSPALLSDPFGFTTKTQAALAEQIVLQSHLVEMAKTGELSVDDAKLLVNAIGHQSLAAIYSEASKLASAKNTAGIKAVGNAGADAVVSLFTLGQMNANLFEATEYDLAVGYNSSYFAARLATELSMGLATGGLSTVSKIGKGLLVLDAAGNTLVAGQGVADMAKCGVTWQNAAQVGDGLFGVGGNAVGVFRRNIRFGGRAGGDDLLRQARAGRGNFNIGAASRSDIDQLGRRWVGPNARPIYDRTTGNRVGLLGEAEGHRYVYRFPAIKASGRTQANLELHRLANGTWGKVSNAHIDLLD